MLQEEYIDNYNSQLNIEDIVIPIENGAFLCGNFYTFSLAPRATVVLNGATGAPARFYDAFAQWLSENKNVNVITYDYRDFGKSATKHIKHSKATMADWGVKDQSAVLRYAMDKAPGSPLWVVGHSLGGLCLLFQEEAKYVERLITVASGPAHWTQHPLMFMPAAFYFWCLAGPVTTASFGYLPGKAIGLGVDLPSGVYWQWRRWCLTKGFHKIDWGKDMPQPDLTRFKGRLDIFGVEDDLSIPAPYTERLKEYYPQAQTVCRVLRPKEFGVKRIGHLGAFAMSNSIVWPALIPE